MPVEGADADAKTRVGRPRGFRRSSTSFSSRPVRRAARRLCPRRRAALAARARARGSGRRGPCRAGRPAVASRRLPEAPAITASGSRGRVATSRPASPLGAAKRRRRRADVVHLPGAFGAAALVGQVARLARLDALEDRVGLGPQLVVMRAPGFDLLGEIRFLDDARRLVGDGDRERGRRTRRRACRRVPRRSRRPARAFRRPGRASGGSRRSTRRARRRRRLSCGRAGARRRSPVSRRSSPRSLAPHALRGPVGKLERRDRRLGQPANRLPDGDPDAHPTLHRREVFLERVGDDRAGGVLQDRLARELERNVLDDALPAGS